MASYTIFCNRDRSPLVKLTIWCLFDTHPLGKPIMIYTTALYVLVAQESKFPSFSIRKILLKMTSQNQGDLVLGPLRLWCINEFLIQKRFNSRPLTMELHFFCFNSLRPSICVGELTIIGSYNDLSPGRRQAIIWANVGILLIGPLETNFSEILIAIEAFSFKKMHLKILSAKCRPFCLGLNVLSHWNMNAWKWTSSNVIISMVLYNTGNSSVLAMELPQSSGKPSICDVAWNVGTKTKYLGHW